MLRTCPRCGDFYADASPLFCLADGTPLIDVDPHGESWTEGSRVVKEKERARRIRTRRLRLRRVISMTTTMLITLAVIVVAAVNTYVYLLPETDVPVVASVSVPWPTPLPSEIPTPTTTPTTTPTLTQCTARDRQNLEDKIAAASSGEWKKAVESEHDRIAEKNLPDGAVNTSVVLQKHFTHGVTFSKTCAPLYVKATYTWVVKWGDSRKMPGGEKHVDVTKTFACRKDGASLRCV